MYNKKQHYYEKDPILQTKLMYSNNPETVFMLPKLVNFVHYLCRWELVFANVTQQKRWPP